MTVQFKDICEKTQAGFRQAPENASAVFTVQTRQVEGFRNEATAHQFNVTVDKPVELNLERGDIAGWQETWSAA